MLLILTNSRDVTTDYLIGLLSDSDIQFIRLDTDTLVGQTQLTYTRDSVTIEVAGRTFKSTDIEHIWYRRPQRLDNGRQDLSPEDRFALLEWEEALEGFLAHVPMPRWMNHPASIALASHKLEQLTTGRALGLTVPDTVVTQDPSTLRRFFHSHSGRIIAKPMAGGYVERREDEADSVIFTNLVTETDLFQLDDLDACPTLFQECITDGRDVRITVVDHDIHAVYLDGPGSQQPDACDIRRNNMDGVSYRAADVPELVERQVRRLMDHYHLRFAAIDMMVSSSETWYYLETNPNGQWAWLDLVGGMKIGQSFVRSFRSMK